MTEPNKLEKITKKYLDRVLPNDSGISYKIEQIGRKEKIIIGSSKGKLVTEILFPSELQKQKFLDSLRNELGIEPLIKNVGFALNQNIKAFRYNPLTKKLRTKKRMKFAAKKQKEETKANIERSNFRKDLCSKIR
ncbi:MAG: hypothetical protein A2X20_00320 [Bacteroidetes bacterium GWE2_40_15]|nr:MAG: hypothetical protein A2X20_00320 [Bacteroidetes bacterium GWE2_40_15]